MYTLKHFTSFFVDGKIAGKVYQNVQNLFFSSSCFSTHTTHNSQHTKVTNMTTSQMSL